MVVMTRRIPQDRGFVGLRRSRSPCNGGNKRRRQGLGYEHAQAHELFSSLMYWRLIIAMHLVISVRTFYLNRAHCCVLRDSFFVIPNDPAWCVLDRASLHCE
jgi:hypothetical protein